MSSPKDGRQKQRPSMCPMIAWYNPRQLARTGVDVAISTIFGRNADYRLTEALSAPPDDDYGDTDQEPNDPLEDIDGIFDYSNRSELWIDYVADSGDGWNSTYAVAYYLAQPGLDLGKPEWQNQRGHILVFGGDEVYPVANRQAYRERLKQPYESALKTSPAPHPRVFAIPGNHDWYDSLVSFTRLFCSRRWFAGWKSRQSRSYFALKLPHGWWLIGTDVQLDSDIDTPQVTYFKRVAAKMGAQDRIILCTAEPHWIYAGAYNDFDPEINENNLAFLESEVFNKRISVYVAGDLHHYRRHATDDGFQKITAGGGGAFLHPTHGTDVSELADGFRLRKAFPAEQESKRLAWGNLWFLASNLWFGALTGFLYTLTAWSVMANVGRLGLSQWSLAVRRTLATAIASPPAVFWILAVVVGFWLFTDTHSKRYKLFGGMSHGLTHLLCTFLIGWAASYFTVHYLRLGFRSFWQLLLAGVIIFICGWIVGSIVMGLYLLISLNLFKRHANEAFSSLGIPDWKSFLRLRIDSRGKLTIFPIGIRRVPRKWKPSGNQAGSAYLPDDTKATAPELIETPVEI